MNFVEFILLVFIVLLFIFGMSVASAIRENADFMAQYQCSEYAIIGKSPNRYEKCKTYALRQHGETE